jgi:hypothetical protein
MPKMKFSLISLIALALTSTSAITATLALAVENCGLDCLHWQGKILQDVPKGRKSPQTTAPYSGVYKKGKSITILCYTNIGTSSVEGNL